MVYNGFLQTRKIGRLPAEGPDSDQEVMGRRWTLTVADTNSLLSRRLITGADGERPAETDVARVQWLLDSNDAYLSNPQDNWENPSPYVDTTGAVSMSAADYRGRTAFDVLNDCAQRSGKNWFVRYYEANDSVPPTNAGSYALWYADADSTQDSSTLRLTNVDADVDDVTTFAVLPDAELSRDPTRAYSGIYQTYDGGSRYDQSTNVVNLLQRQDAAVSNPFVKTDAEAAALNARYLADAETEDDRITCRFIVAKQYVNDLREGQRFEGKFSHLPGYTAAYSSMRCLRRTVKHLNDDFYEIEIEASPIPPTLSIVQQVDNGPYVGNGDETITLPAPVTAGNILVVAWTRRGGPIVLTRVHVNDVSGAERALTAFGASVQFGAPLDASGIAWRVATGDEQVLFFEDGGHIMIWEITGTDAAACAAATVVSQTQQAAASTFPIGTIGASGELGFAVWLYGRDFDDADWYTMGAGWTTDYSDSTEGGSPYTEMGHAGPLSGSIAATSTASISIAWGGMAVSIGP